MILWHLSCNICHDDICPYQEYKEYLSCYLLDFQETGRFLRISKTDSNYHGSICPGNICPVNICPYKEYLSCWWPDLSQTLKVGSWDHDMCLGNICPGNISQHQQYLNCYGPDFDQTSFDRNIFLPQFFPQIF